MRNDAALALRDAADGLATPNFASHAQLSLRGGDIWAGMALVAADKRTRMATYALRIVNGSNRRLRARLRGATATVGGAVSVESFATFETLIPIRIPLRGWDDPACVDVRGHEIAFSIEVPAPGCLATAERAISPHIGVTLSAALLATAVVFSFGVHRMAAPAARAATLSPAALPGAPHNVALAAKDDEPLLDDLTLSPLPARAGSTLHVAYATTATRGDVWLVDLHGQVWAHSSIDPSGKTAIAIPEAAAGREMRVVVHASRGARQAQTGAGLIVEPDNGDLVAVESSGDSGGPAVRVTPTRASSGSTIHVGLPSGHGEALVSLTDSSGSVLQEIDVPAGEKSPITLTAPDVSSSATYDVVVAISKGYSQEEVVRPITVIP